MQIFDLATGELVSDLHEAVFDGLRAAGLRPDDRFEGQAGGGTVPLDGSFLPDGQRIVFDGVVAGPEGPAVMLFSIATDGSGVGVSGLVCYRGERNWLGDVTGPLQGITVLDFTIIYAGPYAGAHLADLGADVIKVESPVGDPFRDRAAVIPGNSKVFQYFNRGKRGMVVDLQTTVGRDVIHRMLHSVDVVLTNFRPGVAARLGIDYETLASIQPQLVYADITAFGHDGPLADRAGGNIIAEAYSGAMAISDKIDEDGAPIRSGLTIADLSTAIAVAMGVSAALVHRERTGEGQRVSASLLRSAISFTGMANMREPVSDAAVRDPLMEEVAQLQASGGSYESIIDARRGYHDLRGGPYHGAYPATDGAIVLGALTPANMAAARAVLEIEEDSLAGGATVAERRASMPGLRARVRKIIATRSVAEWLRDFQAAGVPVAPVNLPEEVADDPQMSSMFVELEHEIAGTQRQVGPIVEMSRSPTATDRAAPTLGQHTTEVLSDFGFSQQEISSLQASATVA
jgi:crotonobetainyl-CoA:carnitine CoA-transferase CaiB-like acyl-CoA transferase